MRKAMLALTAAAIVLSPALVAAQQVRYLDPTDVAQAQREHNSIVQELGGAEAGARAAYVESVGRRVGQFSGVANAGQALHFTTLNSAVENAFSVPGGYVYITRQLLSLMDDESQLAFTLGHETGHIAANHAHLRQEYERHNILNVLAAVFGNMGLGNIIAQRAELATLSYSREQEYQADALGLKFITAAGYDPAGGPEMLAALSRETALQARVEGRTNRRTPEWASTHPLSENRMRVALQEAQATGRLGKGIRNRDQFLSELEGVYVDDDPAQGVIDGPTFTHPDLRIQFRVPPGYLMQNGTEAVTISGSAGKAQFTGGRFSGSLDNAILRAFEQLTQGEVRLNIPPPQHLVINGMPAATSTVRVNTDSGLIDASVVAYQWDPQRVYWFVMLTRGGTGIGPFAPMINSLRKITPEEASAIRPRVIHVVTVARGETVQSLATRMAYRDFQLERFLSLNGLSANSGLVPGQKVKLIVYGPRRA
jgi:predicted Zn-dependent protease